MSCEPYRPLNWSLGCLCHEVYSSPTRNNTGTKQEAHGSPAVLCLCLAWHFLAVRLSITASKKITFDYRSLSSVSQERLLKRCMYTLFRLVGFFSLLGILGQCEIVIFCLFLRSRIPMALFGINHWLFRRLFRKWTVYELDRNRVDKDVSTSEKLLFFRSRCSRTRHVVFAWVLFQ